PNGHTIDSDRNHRYPSSSNIYHSAKGGGRIHSLLSHLPRRYHRRMTVETLLPAQLAYLRLLELPLPEGMTPSELPAPAALAEVPAAPAEMVMPEEPFALLAPEEALQDMPPAPEPPELAPVAIKVDIADERQERIARMDWSLLESSIHACRACNLGESRQHAVVGAGVRQGPWLFVGEAPGAEEDRRGEAFVGRGGQLLDAMLAAMGLSRQREVYIANVLKCRPPQNRDPLGPEVRACLPFLQRQIALLQPRIIVALGRFAAQSLLQCNEPLANLRGGVQRYGEIPLIVTYHPAYLLRNPVEKRKVWEDLKLALQTYAELPPDTAAMASDTE
ncbi:uracil-DNA glycosylase family protein, partial [Candidatus Igneacidithiobacillus taiwanensis]